MFWILEIHCFLNGTANSVQKFSVFAEIPLSFNVSLQIVLLFAHWLHFSYFFLWWWGAGSLLAISGFDATSPFLLVVVIGCIVVIVPCVKISNNMAAIYFNVYK